MLSTAAAHLRRQVRDPVLRQQLTPPYPLGCKRIIYSNDFYPALTRPNVALVTTPIERITPHGIVTSDGVERAALHLLAGLPAAGGEVVEVELEGVGAGLGDQLGVLQPPGRGGADHRHAAADPHP